MRLMSSEAISPAIKEMANPWKIGSKRMTCATHNNCHCGNKHWPKADGARVYNSCIEWNSLAQTLLDEVHQDDRVAHDDARAGHKSNHRRRGEECAKESMRGQDAYQRKWNGGHYDERREERTEPADHQDVDENQHSGEGEPEIAKDFDCNVPFAVPFHGRFCVGEGLRSVIDRDRRAVPTELAGVEFLQALCSWRRSHRRGFRRRPPRRR